MSLLRTLRNLGALLILTVAVFSVTSSPSAAQSSCLPLGAHCSLTNNQCCNHACGPFTRLCCKPFKGMACTSNAQCCSNACNLRIGSCA